MKRTYKLGDKPIEYETGLTQHQWDFLSAVMDGMEKKVYEMTPEELQGFRICFASLKRMVLNEFK